MPIKVIKKYAELKPEYDLLKLFMLRTSNEALDKFEEVYINSAHNKPTGKTLIVTLEVTQDNEFLRSFSWIGDSE